MFFSLNQLALRNSTAPTRPADRSRLVASSIVSRFSELVKNQRGYWSRIEPSWPASASGSSASAKRAQTSSRMLVGQVLGVDPRLGGQLGGQRLAQVLGQPLDLGRLTGHQRVGLDVEGEVRWRPLDPQLGRPPGRQGVVGGVDLDDREPAGVVGEPLLGACPPNRDRTRPWRSSSGRSTTRSRPGCGRPRATAIGSAATSSGRASARRAAPSAPGSWARSRSGAGVGANAAAPLRAGVMRSG